MIKSIIALIFIALLTGHTQALEIDVGVHYVKTQKPNNTLWFQEEFDHYIDRDDVGYQIGLRFNPADNIYVTTGYKYLGEFSVSADFIANDDNYFDWQDGKPAPPLSHLTGKGKAHGIYLKGEYHFKHIFFTGGAWAHKSEWKVRSPEEWDMRRSGPNKGEVIGPFDKTHEARGDTSVSWIAGAGVKFGSVSILAEIWDTTGKGEIPATYLGKSQVITLFYTF